MVSTISVSKTYRSRAQGPARRCRDTATDVHIVKGGYPVRPGPILGHEPVGGIEKLDEGLGW
jgi:hypothetical protein